MHEQLRVRHRYERRRPSKLSDHVTGLLYGEERVVLTEDQQGVHRELCMDIGERIDVVEREVANHLDNAGHRLGVSEDRVEQVRSELAIEE